MGTVQCARLDWPWKILRRMKGPAENHLALCGGTVVVMCGLGFNIGVVYSVEWDSVARKAAEALWSCV